MKRKRRDPKWAEVFAFWQGVWAAEEAMNDEQIAALLGGFGAAYLMDPKDEHCQAEAIRCLVVSVSAAERGACAKACESEAANWKEGNTDDELIAAAREAIASAAAAIRARA